MKILLRTTVGASKATVKANFNRELFLLLTPPGTSLTLKRFDGCRTGDEIHLVMKNAGLEQNWVSIITADGETEKEWYFVDEGKVLPWPLVRWKHRHAVESLDEKTSCIVDDIDFKCSNRLLERVMQPILWLAFSVRPVRYKKYFEGLV